ncbi:MAG: hypothetical protein H7175_23790 [Burkholderiales bacterium]|nr:hypothetical protein [Anaerolineae bacterium]
MARSRSSMTLAYSILVGPILWFVHFAAVYSVAEFGCGSNFNNLMYISPANIRIVIVAITLPALILVAIGGLLAYRGWVSLRDQSIGILAGERERFLIKAAILLNGLFLLSIVATTVPTFFVNACDLAV